MTSEGSDGSHPSSPLDPSNEISLWLSRLHLLQYATSFTQAGYYTLADCRDLTEEKLLQVAHFPTGHRRRILHNLELLKAGDCDIEGSEMGGVKKKPVPFPRTIFLKDGRRVTSSQNPQTNNTGDNRLPGTQTLPARAYRKTLLQHDPDFISTVSHTLPHTKHKAPLSNSRSPIMASSNESLSLSSHSLPSDWENFFKDLNSSTLSIAQSVSGDTDDGRSVGFQGVMVDNDIYESSQFMDSGPRSTRSYKLRHRPVPEIPQCTIPLLDWYVVAQYSIYFFNYWFETVLFFACLSEMYRMYKRSIMINCSSKQLNWYVKVMFHKWITNVFGRLNRWSGLFMTLITEKQSETFLDWNDNDRVGSTPASQLQGPGFNPEFRWLSVHAITVFMQVPSMFISTVKEHACS